MSACNQAASPAEPLATDVTAQFARSAPSPGQGGALGTVYDDRYFIDFSPRAYALAVNVLMWAMSR